MDLNTRRWRMEKVVPEILIYVEQKPLLATETVLRFLSLHLFGRDTWTKVGMLCLYRDDHEIDVGWWFHELPMCVPIFKLSFTFCLGLVFHWMKVASSMIFMCFRPLKRTTRYFCSLKMAGVIGIYCRGRWCGHWNQLDNMRAAG